MTHEYHKPPYFLSVDKLTIRKMIGETESIVIANCHSKADARFITHVCNLHHTLMGKIESVWDDIINFRKVHPRGRT